MKAPDRNNYEVWVIDYFDGKLSKEKIELLRQFVAQNPDLEIDLDEAMPAMDASDDAASFKTDLKRGEDKDFVLNFFEARINGVSDEVTAKVIADDPDLSAELRALEKTILVADHSIAFSRKEILKKSEEDWFAAEKPLAEFEAGIDSGVTVPESYPRLVADEHVRFPAIASLRREAQVVPLFSRRMFLRAAAVLFMLFGCAVVFFQWETASDTTVAVVKSEDVDKVSTDSTKSYESFVSTTIPRNDFTTPASKTNVPVVKKIRSVPVTVPSPDATNAIDEKQTELPVAPEKNELMSPLLAEVLPVTQMQDSVLSNQPSGSERAMTTVIPFAEIPYAEADDEEVVTRKSWLQKIASIAGDANKLGVAKIDGETEGNARFRIKLFDFSVERIR